MEYTARNHNQLAPLVYADLQRIGVKQTSRNGPVLRMPRVTTLVALCPRERVCHDSVRDSNPFFHLVEAAAMLAPANNVDLLAFMAKNMRSFSDDGETYNAFYGTRAREWAGAHAGSLDQLDLVIAELAVRPDSRQALVQLWDPVDLTKTTKDKACNLCMLFQVSPAGELEMTTFNRSNDAIWGILTGANVVHLSLFQEYVACALGLEVGAWTHVSNNLHVYTDNPQWLAMQTAPLADLYSVPANIGLGAMMFAGPTERVRFDRDLKYAVNAMRHGVINEDLHVAEGMHAKVDSQFLKDVLAAFLAFAYRKRGASPDVVQEWLHRVMAPDWHLACCMWVQRRAQKGGAS